MTTSLRFDNRVAVVTGAGAGLGRQYALLLAKRGAKVVVNDLGGSRSGEGSNSSAADKVVSEIRQSGGIAVADYNSVVNGYNIIKTALDHFGRIDILINNAGILRDKSFQKMSSNEWDIIQDVHLKGAFITTQAAWEHFKNQKYGRIIFTSSNAGLYGNFGQANYSAAKMGLVGLCNTISLEGKKYNIYSNVIVPTAASRLTEDILPPDLFEELKPELIAPVVTWLCHEDCDETGSIIESAAGWAGKQALVRGKGALLRRKISDRVEPEIVRDNWNQIINMTNAEKMDSIQEVTVALMSCLEQLHHNNEEKSNKAPKNDEDLNLYQVNSRDFIIYAFGIGASVENKSDLKYLYENHEEFQAFPTQCIIPGQISIMTSPIIMSAIPNRTFDLSQVLHGEQYLEIFKQLPLDIPLRSELKIVDVLDKGKNAVIVCGAHTYDDRNELICYNEMAVFIRGEGGFGGPSVSSKAVPIARIPSRAPDAICFEDTSCNQAALYRLSGDTNPLHIDPSFAQLGGFEKPILHGLCTLGFSARHVLLRYGNNNPSYFKSIKVRFVKPFIPGETLRTLMWREENRIYFQTQTKQNEVIIDGAYLDLHKIVDNISLDHGSVKLEFIDPNSSTLSNRIIISKMARVTEDPSQETAVINSAQIPLDYLGLQKTQINLSSCIGNSACSKHGNDNAINKPSSIQEKPENIILSTFFGSKL